MFLLLFCSALCLGAGKTLHILCDGQYNETVSPTKTLSVKYLRESRICASFCWSGYTCSEIPSWLGLTCPRAGMMNKKQVKVMMGSVCNSTDMCTVFNKDAVCFSGRCLCKPGLSLDRNSQCVKGCEEYGSSFTIYKGLSIKGHNDESYYFKDFEFCKWKCIQTTNFTCVSMEVGYKQLLPGIGPRKPACFLCKEGFLDVPEEDRCSTDKDYSLSTRNCKGAPITF